MLTSPDPSLPSSFRLLCVLACADASRLKHRRASRLHRPFLPGRSWAGHSPSSHILSSSFVYFAVYVLLLRPRQVDLACKTIRPLSFVSSLLARPSSSTILPIILSPCEPITIPAFPARPTHITRISCPDIMNLTLPTPAFATEELYNIWDEGHHRTFDELTIARQIDTS